MNASSFSHLRIFPTNIKQAQSEMGDVQCAVPKKQGTEISPSWSLDKAQELQNIEWKQFLAS